MALKIEKKTPPIYPPKKMFWYKYNNVPSKNKYRQTKFDGQNKKNKNNNHKTKIYIYDIVHLTVGLCNLNCPNKSNY